MFCQFSNPHQKRCPFPISSSKHLRANSHWSGMSPTPIPEPIPEARGPNALIGQDWARLALNHKGLVWKRFCYCSVAHSCPTLFNSMDYSTPGFPVPHDPVLHDLSKFAHTHDHRDGDAIQPYHSLLPPSPPALTLSQPQCLFQ